MMSYRVGDKPKERRRREWSGALYKDKATSDSEFGNLYGLIIIERWK